MITRITTVLFSSLALFLFLSANAQSTERIILPTRSEGTILDQFTFDGLPNTIDTRINQVQLEGGQFDARAIIDFDLNVIPNGKRIARAILVLMPLGRTFHPEDTSIPIEIRGFASNGVLQLKDFHSGRFVRVIDGFPMELGVRERVDVTAIVRDVFRSERKLVGFVLRTTARGGMLFGSRGFVSPAKLEVVLVDAT